VLWTLSKGEIPGFLSLDGYLGVNAEDSHGWAHNGTVLGRIRKVSLSTWSKEIKLRRCASNTVRIKWGGVPEWAGVNWEYMIHDSSLVYVLLLPEGPCTSLKLVILNAWFLITYTQLHELMGQEHHQASIEWCSRCWQMCWAVGKAAWYCRVAWGPWGQQPADGTCTPITVCLCLSGWMIFFIHKK